MTMYVTTYPLREPGFTFDFMVGSGFPLGFSFLCFVLLFLCLSSSCVVCDNVACLVVPSVFSNIYFCKSKLTTSYLNKEITLPSDRSTAIIENIFTFVYNKESLKHFEFQKKC